MSDPKASPKPLAIFRAGRHTAVDGREIEFTPAMLKDAAAAYDCAAHEAPLVVGHPQLNAPAYGWVDKFSFNDDGTVLAEPKQVNPDFAELVNSGAFKKMSASWYLPDSPGNPKPGKLYLRHVGFLGAAPPSLKGLADASFGENDGSATVEFAAGAPKRNTILRRLLAAIKDSDLVALESAEVPAPAFAEPAALSGTHEENMKTNEQAAADFAERESALKKKNDELAAQETALKAREATIANAEREAAKKGTVDFVEGLAKEGKILPRHKAALVEVMCAFPANAEVSFAEGSQTVKKSPGEALKDFLNALPKQIDFAEKSRDESQLHGDNVVNFAAPENAQVDGGRLEVHQKALAYQAAHPKTDYIAAVRAVGGR